MRCEQCKHWEPTEQWDVEAGGLRRCSRALPRWIIENDVPDAVRSMKYGCEESSENAAYKAAAEIVFAKAMVAVNDGSQYYAELLTRPDFGCVLHEPI